MKIFQINSKYIFVSSILLIVCFGTFFSSLSNPFTNYDDNRLITNNQIIREFSLENIKLWFSAPYDNLYQPLNLFSWAIDYRINAYNPLTFHIHNIILHCLNAFLVFLIVFKLFQQFYIAFIACIIFAIHPVQVESVVWLSERKNLLFGFYFLLALYQYVLYCKNGNKKYLVLSVLFVLVSNLSKGQGVLFFIIAFAVDYLYNRTFKCIGIWIEKVPFLVIAIVFAFITIQSVDLKSAYLDGIDISFVNRILYGLYAFFKYVFVLFYPPALSCFYPYTFFEGQIPVYVVIIGLLFLVLFAFIYLRSCRVPVLFFGYTLFVCLIIPMLNFVKYIPVFYMSNHYLYLSTVGFGIFCGYWIVKVFRNQILQNIIFVLTGLVFIWFTIVRIGYWSSNISLWDSVLNKYPRDPWVLNMKALSLAGEGKMYAAIDVYNQAVGIDDKRYVVYYNRANSMKYLKRVPEALEDYSKAIALQPAFDKAYVNRGATLLESGDIIGALNDFNRAIEVNPNYAGAYFNRGYLFLKKRDFNNAQRDFEIAVKLDNYFPEAHFQLSMILMGKRENERAIYHLCQVIKLRPDYAPSYFFRAECYFKNGNRNLACEDWKKSESLGFQHAAEKLNSHCR